jgi:hypothetical protein
VTDTKVAVAAIGVAKPSSCTSNRFFEQVCMRIACLTNLRMWVVYNT